MTDQLQARLDRLLGWTPEPWLPMRRGYTPAEVLTVLFSPAPHDAS